MKRWDWTWEEPRVKARAESEPNSEAPPPSLAAALPPSSSQRFRRRRLAAAGAAGAAILLVLAIVAILSAHSASHRAARASSPSVGRTAAPLPSAAAAQALERKAEARAIDHVLSYAPAVSSGGTHGEEVALTFDDGPGPYTQRLVSMLNKLHVHATFFPIGEEERYFSAGTSLELRSGDVVGDHTETHPMMASLSAREQHEELFEQIARIELLDGPRPRLFRPPYGSFNATTLKQLRAMRLLMVLWSTDTKDYTLPGVHAIAQSALAGAHPGAIILMHDAGGDRSETIAALPSIVAGLRKKGLRPVTVPRLMLDDPPPRGRPIPTSLVGD
jgi:peptidoglycan/xylan/chitin deacetylase (PgdA/CDA1 family)